MSTPYAIFVYDWPELGPCYRIVGGRFDGSDVMAATLIQLGIAIPERKAA